MRRKPIGVPLKDNDVTFRCNLVTLSDEENYEDKTMLDYSAGEITTEEAAELIKAVAKELDTDMIKFYPVSATVILQFGRAVRLMLN